MKPGTSAWVPAQAQRHPAKDAEGQHQPDVEQRISYRMRADQADHHDRRHQPSERETQT
jgi:hypothetical protein